MSTQVLNSVYVHRVKPSLLEYLSYHLNFMSVIAGPCNNFKDYIAFIEGRHIHMKLLEVNWKQRGFHSLPEPSPTVSSQHSACFLGFHRKGFTLRADPR